MNATQQISALYLALFDRPADVGGQQYWLTRLQSIRATTTTDAAALVGVAAEMAASPESSLNSATPALAINTIYQNLFGHTADAGGAAYWSNALASGSSIASVAVAIINAAPSDATMNNRVAAAGNFTASLQTPLQQTAAASTTATAAVKAYLASVTADPATLTAATAALPGTLNTITQALTASETESLYVAIFNRAADPGGLAYWQTQLANGASMQDVARGFASSAEFTKLYGTATPAQIIDTFYQDFYGRVADAGGSAYWQQKMAGGAMTSGDVALAVILGAHTTDATASANKIQVATGLTQALQTQLQVSAYGAVGANAIVQQYLSGVTADPASVTTALANVNTVVNTLVALITPATPSAPAAPTPPSPITDTAANLITHIASIVPGTDVTVTGSVSLTQLATIDSANGNGALVYTDVTGSPAALATNTGGYVKAGINVVITDSAGSPETLAQLAAIDAANGAGTLSYSNIADTAAALIADGGTYVNNSTNVIITDATSIAQLTLVRNENANMMTWTSIADTATNLATDINNSGFWVSPGVNVTVTTAGSISQLQTIDGANGAGALNYTALQDNAAHLVTNTGGYLKAGIAATVTGNLSVAQLNTIDTTNGSASVTYGTGTLVYDGASTPGTIANFVSGTNHFTYTQSVITHGAGTSADGISGGEIASGVTVAATLAINNADALVYIAQNAITGNQGEVEIAALAAGFTAPKATALVNKLVNTGALSGTIAGLDAAQGSGSVLWVLNTGTDTVLLRVTDADTSIPDTLISPEVQVIGVFTGTAHLVAGDFV